MAWWDDAAEAVGSAIGWVGDAVEGAVDAGTEIVEEFTESATEVATEVLDYARDAAATVSPVLGGLANVALGLLKGGVQAAQDASAIVLDAVRNLGNLVSDVLHLNLGRVVGDLLNLGINVLQAVVWVIRVGTGAYVGAAISDYFARDAALSFIRTTILDEFGEKAGNAVLTKLGWGTGHFGLPITASVSIMRADSDSFPFVDLHDREVLDLYRLAGVASFESVGAYLNPFRERTRVVRVDDDGNDMWYLPVHRYAIRSFLESGGTNIRLRAYSMEPYAAAKAMRTAHKKFKKLCIDLSFDTSFNFPSWQTFNFQPCQREDDFVFDTASRESALWFAQRTSRNGDKKQDGNPLCIGIFGYLNRPTLNGLTTGRDIKRKVAPDNGCEPDSTADRCISRILRRTSDYSLDSNDDGVDDLVDGPCGSGVTWKDSYPPWFSRFVLAHELGHYFGLAHAGHDGVHNLMFSLAEGNEILGEGSWRLWSNGGEPAFVEKDIEHAWRFIVKEMKHVLEGL